MKRSLLVLLALSLFLAACATTPPAPSVSGVVTQRSGNVLTVTPADGQPATVNVTFGTKVEWFNGLEAERSAITAGMPVKVWLSNGTQNAAKIVISQ